MIFLHFDEHCGKQLTKIAGGTIYLIYLCLYQEGDKRMNMKQILSIALLLGFLMISGNALALDTHVSGQEVGVTIASKQSDGTPNFFFCNTGDTIVIKYLWPNNEEWKTESLSNANPNDRIMISPYPPNVDWTGYQANTDSWFVSEVNQDGNGSSHYYLTLKPAPLNYYIDYYDGNKWLASQDTTIEKDAVFSSTASKNGYIFKGWDLNPAGDTVRFGPGEVIAKAWLMGIENPSSDNSVKLYAVWESSSVELPQTGDDSNLILWSALAFISVIGLMTLVRKKKEA